MTFIRNFVRNFVRMTIRMILVVWASPGSLFGVIIGTAGLMTGGHVQYHTGVLEFYGGANSWFLNQMPIGGAAAAITFGHTVLGQTQAALDITRTHERIHVRQYERWGPFFIPAYSLCSIYLFLRGRDAYRENPFEVEAYSNS